MRSLEDRELRRRRHHHHKEQTELQQWLRAYRIEGVWMVVVGLGVFLVVERMNIRQTLLRDLRSAASGLAQSIDRAGRAITGLIARVSLADGVGAVLIFGACLVLLLRVRWRLMRSEALTATDCPVCGGRLHRVHRRLFDRMLSWYLPVRRYRCADPKCGWGGLRIYAGEGEVSSHTRMAT
jgi:hypothetical protein